MNFSLLTLALTLLAPASQPAEPTAESTVVCLGDSITKAGYPEQLAKRLGVAVHNAGVGGNTSSQGLARMQKDVLGRRPKVVVILFGTNDSRMDGGKALVPVEKYTANLTQMVDACQQTGAKVAICTMPPINPEPYFKRHDKAPFDAVGGFEKVLAEYRAAAKRVAQERKATLIDLNAALANEPTWQGADGVHPSKEGLEIIGRIVGDAVTPLLPHP